MRDLFEQDDGGWLENVALLDSLVAEKLKAEAEKIAAEGWKWIEVNVDFPFGHTHRLRELDGTPTDLTAEEQATIEALKSAARPPMAIAPASGRPVEHAVGALGHEDFSALMQQCGG